MWLLFFIIIFVYLSAFFISYIFLSLYVYREAKVLWKDCFSCVYGISNVLLLIIILEIANFEEAK